MPGVRMIGYGRVDSTSEAVETVAEIRKRIEKGVEVFGAKTMLVDPDCGLRMRSRESAFWKLRNMAEAAKEARLAL
jgi:5-methyltetrahydropteroyltriglutamate--homocysteine methyltransferase